MKSKTEPLTQLTFLVPREESEELACAIEMQFGLMPAIVSKPGLKLEKVMVYLDKKTNEDKFINTLKETFPIRFKVQRALIHETDWRDKWKEGLRPFKLTKNIRVIPSWIDYKEKSKLIEIQLDPGFAFGSGRHATTMFMARMIEKKKSKCKTLLDIGCGSGILCVAAAKLGYERALGIDLDPNSLNASIENALKNNVSNETQFKTESLEDFSVKEEFDFIAANLESSVLIENAKRIHSLMSDNTYLAISGIAYKNRKEVHKIYRKMGLRCIRKFISPEWCGYLYKKKRQSIKARVVNKIKRKKK